MDRNNVNTVLFFLISELDIPVTKKSIEEEISRHPEYHSLLAISDLLNNWRIPNSAYQLSYDQLVSAGVQTPFIAHLNEISGFVIVHELKGDFLIVSNEKYRKKRISAADFELDFSGAVLIAEKGDESGEADFHMKDKQEKISELRIPVILACSAMIFLAYLFFNKSYVSAFGLSIAILTLLKTTGLITSVLLLVQSIDSNNALITRLCSNDGKNGCNAILSSEASKITEGLSWSEVGFFYFFGTWLMLISKTDQIGILQLIFLTNLLALPYTFYSIYYQWRIAKQWCILCCSVQIILWLELISFLPLLKKAIQIPTSTDTTVFILSLISPVLIWYFIKPFFKLSKQLKPLKQQLRHFKYNTTLFNKLISEEMRLIFPTDEQSLIIGDRGASQIVTLVSNPYCQPCSKTHKILGEWLESREDVKLQVIFSSQNNSEDPKTKVARHLMSLQQHGDHETLKSALNDWYAKKFGDFEQWTSHYPSIESVDANDSVRAQKDWCSSVGITQTPTVFLNGRRLPQSYKLEDIKYFI